MEPLALADFFAEQKARYGELFWYEQRESRTVLMLEALAQKARSITGAGAGEIISFESDDSVGDWYEVEAEQIDVEQRPDWREYESITDTALNATFTDLTNDLFRAQLVRVYRPQGYRAWCVVAYHSFGARAPRGPIGWLRSLEGLRKLERKQFSVPPLLVSLEESCRALEGAPYRIGAGSLKNGFDCSALAQRVIYETRGFWLPRKARWQALVCDGVSMERVIPGDLVFFRKKGKEHIDHVALVTGLQPGKLPIVFHAKRIMGKVLFQDLNIAAWLNEWDIVSCGRVQAPEDEEWG